MSDRVTRILLVYFERVDAPPRRPETILLAAREAFTTLLGAKEVLFYKKQGDGFHRIRRLPSGASDPYIPIRDGPQDETISNETMACMAQSAGRPVCVSQDDAGEGGHWAVPFGGHPIWGFAYCDLPKTPDTDALQGAMRVAGSLHGHREDILSWEGTQGKKLDTVAMVSHEFKTPLTIAITATEVLQKKLKKDGLYAPEDAVYQYVNFLILNLYKTQRLSANLIDCVGMDFYPHMQEGVDVAACLREIEKQVLPYMEERKAVFTLEQATPQPVLCVCDPFFLERIALNLITNAVQHAPVGGHVTVRLRNAPALVRIAVENDGKNIPAEAMPHLFEKFWRGGEARGGTGLGLYISQCLAGKMGGSIQAENREEGGARFTLTLPVHSGVPKALGSARALYRPYIGELVRIELSVLRDVEM